MAAYPCSSRVPIINLFIIEIVTFLGAFHLDTTSLHTSWVAGASLYIRNVIDCKCYNNHIATASFTS